MTGAQYERVADEYARSYGEPLVAAADWVEPIWEMCSVAVACDPSAPDGEESLTDYETETVSRTAAVICLMTYGVGRWRSTKRVSS